METLIQILNQHCRMKVAVLSIGYAQLNVDISSDHFNIKMWIENQKTW